MIIRMVKRHQLGKIAKQAGQNKQAAKKYFSDLSNEQAEICKQGGKRLEKFKQVCSSIRDFRVELPIKIL